MNPRLGKPMSDNCPITADTHDPAGHVVMGKVESAADRLLGIRQQSLAVVEPGRTGSSSWSSAAGHFGSSADTDEHVNEPPNGKKKKLCIPKAAAVTEP